ncbi:MAG: hypothetical protein WC688_01740 [Parachlamydiales bacterium]|jgi:hypothetical protein
MTSPTVLHSQSVVSYIISGAEKLTQENYKIQKITLKILSIPYKLENDEFQCYYELNHKIERIFLVGFDKSAYLSELIEIFKKLTQSLQEGGCFARLSCNVKIESRKETSNGIPDNWDREMKIRVQGYVATPEWEQSLFSAPKNSSTSSI